MNSRGASIQWLSQYPHEEELLFPPCTGLACLDVSTHGGKRCVRVNAQVSTARLDTAEVATPIWVPGTAAAMEWVAQQMDVGVVELASMEKWDLESITLSDPELLLRVTLLLCRASSSVAARSADLKACNLCTGAKHVADMLKVNTTLTDIK